MIVDRSLNEKRLFAGRRKASRENKQKLCSRETYAEVRLSRANARPYVYAKVLSKRRLSHRPFPEDIGIYIR